MNSEDRGDLRAFFEPAAVAAVGSLRKTPGTAYRIISNIRQFGFSGPVYPVNPSPSNYGEVFGSRAYGSVEEIEQPVDLAAVITPPSTVPEIVEQCARKAANVWIYGTSLPAMEELARQLQARGLPAYLDLAIAVRSLGYAACYAKVRSSLEEESQGSQEALTRMERTPMEVS